MIMFRRLLYFVSGLTTFVGLLLTVVLVVVMASVPCFVLAWAVGCDLFGWRMGTL